MPAQIAPVSILLREALQGAREQGGIARKQRAQHVALGLHDVLFEAPGVAGELTVGRGEVHLGPPIDEYAARGAREVVACRAVGAEACGQRLPRRQYFLYHDVDWKPCGIGVGQGALQALGELAQIADWIVEPIHVIQADAADFSVCDQRQQAAVAGIEDHGQLDAQRGQLADVEKTPVIYGLQRQLPGAQAIVLALQHRVEKVEALGLARAAAQRAERAVQGQS